MPLQKSFRPQRRKYAWGAMLIGVGLLADAVWCITHGQSAAALVVGGVGLERVTYAVADAWAKRQRPYRLTGVRLDAAGMWFEEREPYGGRERTTLLPGGLLLDANVQRGVTRGKDAPWLVLIYSILGTFQWSSHESETEADDELARVRAALDERVPGDLKPPEPSGLVDILPEKRAVMWGVAPVVPISIALRALCCLSTIAAVPYLATGVAAAMLWGLTGITVALLAFPFIGAVSVLWRTRGVLAFGAVVQDGELRALERSTVSHAVRARAVEHIGLGDIVLNGDPVTLRLVAHVERGEPVDAIVPRSVLLNLAQQALRALAELHERSAEEVPRWSVRVPGGFMEGIEVASWAQRFVAEAQQPG